MARMPTEWKEGIVTRSAPCTTLVGPVYENIEKRTIAAFYTYKQNVQEIALTVLGTISLNRVNFHASRIKHTKPRRHAWKRSGRSRQLQLK
jgi:hypothetical protein